MDLLELVKIVAYQKQHGLDGAVMKKSMPKSGITSENTRTPFGLCRVLGENTDGTQLQFFVTLAQMEKFLRKSGVVVEWNE